VAPGSENWTQKETTVEVKPYGTIVANVVTPTLTLYLPEKSKATGTGIIVAPAAFTIIRVNAHTPARKQPFAEVKKNLTDELQKSRYEKRRSGLAKQLRAKAKIEVG
jgi:hypothetical protein